MPLTALALLLVAAGPSAHAGTAELVSVTPRGGVGNGPSYIPVLSRDGRVVAFTSLATDLVPGGTNHDQDVFVRDRQTGTTERLSVKPGGSQTRKGSYHSAISADGQVAAFVTASDDLIPGDNNHTFDALVRSR